MMKLKFNAAEPTATEVMHNRYYKGRPERIAQLEQVRLEDAKQVIMLLHAEIDSMQERMSNAALWLGDRESTPEQRIEGARKSLEIQKPF